MASKYHKKIKNVLKEADLPKELSKDLKKELESHFYEKESDLRFSGMTPEEIESSLKNDFGDEKLIGSAFQWVHKFSLNSLMKTFMKKIIIALSIFLFALIFAAPWLWYDNGEDILENGFFSGKEDQNFNKPLERIPVLMGEKLGENFFLSDSEIMCYCDGSCMRVEWAPFGATVKACAEDYYYVTFWGQQFHINGK